LFHGLLDGHITIDATSTILKSHFNLDGDLMDIAASALGSIAVLIVGTIWRRRKLAEPHGKIEATQTAE
jgi:hypothetical protein